jgi:hypothetical protein
VKPLISVGRERGSVTPHPIIRNLGFHLHGSYRKNEEFLVKITRGIGSMFLGGSSRIQSFIETKLRGTMMVASRQRLRLAVGCCEKILLPEIVVSLTGV